jgi:protein tyrosine phosphatase (PTP) superfamily phosphohydrolase (DUF442 family)
MKIRQLEEKLYVEGQIEKDRHEEANSRFSNLITIKIMD